MKRVALVTGASRGIGRATAVALAAQGFAVAVNYVSNTDAANAVLQEIRAKGGTAHVIQGDISLPETGAMLAEQTERALGPIHTLVNNAGVILRGTLADFNGEALQRMRGVNVDGLINVTRAVSERMKERKSGRIINLTSVAAFGTAMDGTTFYAATKAAVIALTRRFAYELGPSGITVNAVAPGFILTDMVMSGHTREEASRLVETMASRAMLNRVGAPEDIAGAVVFLASEEARFITAQVLTVDGGRMDYFSQS